MRPLPLPSFTVSDVIDRCEAHASSELIRTKLTVDGPAIVHQEGILADTAIALEWWRYGRSTHIGALSNAEMKMLYTVEMSRKGGAAFRYYSKLKNSAPHDRCPMCGVGVVASLDHYLPKSQYSDIAVTPSNLIPACNDCNTFKHVRFPRRFEDQLIHPYYDNFTTYRWLRGSVNETSPPTVRFYVDSEEKYEVEDEQRLRNHFDVLRLARRFGSYAGEQLTVEKANLTRVSNAAGVFGMTGYLTEQIQKYAPTGQNSWQTAFFHALHDSAWFVTEGFMEIPD